MLLFCFGETAMEVDRLMTKRTKICNDRNDKTVRGRQKMDKDKLDLEKLLAEGKNVCVPPVGYSMYPVIVPDRDKVVIAPVKDTGMLKRGDVVLYRREGSILVLHRIWKVKKDGFYMVGDGQSEVEGPVSGEQVRGMVTVLIRKGREVPTEELRYRLATGLWLYCRPFRPVILRFVRKIKRCLKKIKSRIF